MRAFIRRILKRPPSIEEELNSTALRAAYRARDVDVGLYSYGCFDAQRIGRNVTIGRYCSFADTARIYTRNHGIGFLGLTAYFYNTNLGVVDTDPIAHAPVVVADDVWVGHAAILLPGVGTVGRGAIIAAGAVVTKPVPAYAVVAGNPARVIRMRFDAATIAKIEATRWWERTPDQLRQMVRDRPDLVFSPGKAPMEDR